jgi:hypothetical protein
MRYSIGSHGEGNTHTLHVCLSFTACRCLLLSSTCCYCYTSKLTQLVCTALLSHCTSNVSTTAEDFIIGAAHTAPYLHCVFVLSLLEEVRARSAQ